jgi:hypothetical protein
MPGTYNSSFFCRSPYTKCYSVNSTGDTFNSHIQTCRNVFGGRKVVYKWVPAGVEQALRAWLVLR